MRRRAKPATRGPRGASGSSGAYALGEAIDAALGRYASRGVFRGFSRTDGPGGVRRYSFIWLTRRPMTVALSRDRRTITFVALFPAVATFPALRARLTAEMQSAASPSRPAHRRIDPRRATMTPRVSKGDLALRVSLAPGFAGPGRAADAVVRSTLGLVNDLFLFLHECYPDYLAAHFGIPDE